MEALDHKIKELTRQQLALQGDEKRVDLTTGSNPHATNNQNSGP